MEAPLWLYPESVVSKVGTDYMEEIRLRQQTLIALLLAPGAITNVNNARLQSNKAYPVEEYLDDVFGMVWKPLGGSEQMGVLGIRGCYALMPSCTLSSTWTRWRTT